MSLARIDVNKPQPINKRKIFWAIAIVLVAAGYQLAHPYLERQFNVDLPSLVEEDSIATTEPKREWKESDWEIPDAGDQPLIGESDEEPSDTGKSNANPSSTQQKGEAATDRSKSSNKTNLGRTTDKTNPTKSPIQTKTGRRDQTKSNAANPNQGKSNSGRQTGTAKPKSENAESEPYLTPTGKKNRLRSPAGLIYGESRGEHRVDHVMRHAKDDPSRRLHSVFEGDKKKILKVIDEAYRLIESKSNRVQKTPDKKLDFRAKYTVDMKRKIGYLGGQIGKRQNYPPRSKLSLVLDNGKFMVTAYPDR